MPALKTQVEIDFLKRVDARLRNCDFQAAIARDEHIKGGPGGLASKLRSMGFKTLRGAGGWRVVDALMERDLTEWLSTGELAAAPAEAEKVAA